MAKEVAPPTPVPIGDPKKDEIKSEEFCASVVDTNRTFMKPNDNLSKAMEILTEK